MATLLLTKYKAGMGEGAEEEQGPQRPRVVDKRVSARGTGAEATPPAPSPPESTPSAPRSGAPEPLSTPATPAPPPGEQPPDAEHLWTPEQEEQARRLAQEIRDTPSADWVLNTAVTLVNVAATKLDAGLTGEAQLAIDALAGMVGSVAPRLGDAGSALRQTVAQLQMAYAQSAPPPTTP